RCECENVSGLAAVRLLPAPPLVDQGFAGGIYFALGDRGGPSVRLVSLDAAAGRFGQWSIVGALRDRRSALVQRTLAWARIEHRRVYLEMDAVLDRNIPRRADEDSSG